MVARIQKEQEDNMSEMDKAKELLKMKTVKIQRAAPQEVSCEYNHSTPFISAAAGAFCFCFLEVANLFFHS